MTRPLGRLHTASLCRVHSTGRVDLSLRCASDGTLIGTLDADRATPGQLRALADDLDRLLGTQSALPLEDA